MTFGSGRATASCPGATYRLQLRPDFGFDEAAAVADYLAALGVTHLYASPYLQAAPGSTHGYDVVDHSKVNDELGGPEGHGRLCAALSAVGLGQVLDIVPNHMAVTPQNAWWTDVLENGPSSRYAAYFDVDWDPPERKLRNTVLLPVLADHYGRVLEAGELRVERNGGALSVRYFDRVLPLAPPTYDLVLGLAAVACDDDDLAFLAGAFGRLPPATATDRLSAESRHRDKEVLKRELARVCADRPEVGDAVDAAVAAVNTEPDLLDGLLDRQNYRLAHWRTAGEEMDYRRFFDIDSLAGLRMEDERVFTDTHALVVAWLDDGLLSGVRVDHPDGLRDPQQYFDRLRSCTPGGWIVVEKILEVGEQLPESWPIDGTTGYDFLNHVARLLVDSAGEVALTEAYGSFSGEPTDYSAVVHQAKHLAAEQVLAADMHRLTNLFARVCESERRYRDFTRAELATVLVEAVASFDVYRTYATPGADVTAADGATIDRALEAVLDRRPDLDPELVDLLGHILRGQLDGPAAELCWRFQQTSGPVMAKGVEDTAFYRYVRLTALNEVGGDPGRFGTTVAQFHQDMATTADRWPGAMLASSTHDTKRSEDVRARLSLLAEVPGDLAAAVGRWSAMNERHRRDGWPDRNFEWLLYQTLIGAHPLSPERALGYVEKATKEAKRYTSWTDPVESYDAAVRRFTEGALGDDAFTADMAAFVEPLIEPGWINALAAQLVKLTAPGVPDIYQGTELWDLSLVDPDNRRAVDFERRRAALAELDGMSAADAWARRDEGFPKLLVTRDALHLRRRLPDVFTGGSYEPLPVAGPAADHVVAYMRGGRVATVVPRLPIALQRSGGWRDTTVDVPWLGRLTVADLLAEFPVALLEGPA